MSTSISLFDTIYHLCFLKEVCDVPMIIHRSIFVNVGVKSIQKHLVCKISDFAGQMTSQIITQHNDL